MWEINVKDQLGAAFWAALCGAVLCVLYDVFRALRKNGLRTKFAVFVQDILFATISAFFVFAFLMRFTKGEYRGYVPASFLTGFLCYNYTLSRFSAKLFIFMFSKIKKTMRFLILIERKICERIVSLSAYFNNVLKHIFQGVKKLLKK